jgi:hypothetical protein
MWAIQPVMKLAYVRIADFPGTSQAPIVKANNSLLKAEALKELFSALGSIFPAQHKLDGWYN